MENEIKVGDFVRTNKGVIYKFTNEIKHDIQMQDFILYNDGKTVKHSPNLIDLIEERRLCKWRKGCRYI